MRRDLQLDIDALVDRVSARLPASKPSVRKAIKYLQNQHDAPLEFDRAKSKWVLHDPDFSLPLLDPTPEDVVAVAIASALLSPLGDPDLDRRIRGLLEELDERITQDGKGKHPLRNNAVLATASAKTLVQSRIIGVLARAIGRGVVRLQYGSPWSGKRGTHVIEPWQLRIHDGVLYVRGWNRSKKAPSTYRVAHIQSAILQEGEPPRQPRPASRDIWGPEGPGSGVDDDRPSIATIRVRGPMARYIAPSQWHKDQRDRWLEKDELLERTFAYESCRETARRLLTLGDALEHVHPPILLEELATHVRALHTLVRHL